MKKMLINYVKYSRFLYYFYYYIMNTVIYFLGIFIRTEKRLILFNSYAGRKYDDSPKIIFEQIKKDHRFSKHRLVWAFHQPSDFQVEGAEVIKTDTMRYFLTALKAGVWVTNSSVERGLHFKKKEAFYLNTWHGTPIKKMGSDIGEVNQSFSVKKSDEIDCFLVQSDFEQDVFLRTFHVPVSNFLKCGLPRNDILSHYSEEERALIRQKLNIPEDRKVILYCPTYREFEKDSNKGCMLKPPMDLPKWKNELGNEYVLFFRAHYEVATMMDIQDDIFVRNMTLYPSLNELMIASDLLISDYSSVFIDYSIMDKPMYHFTYDYEKYTENRGLYFDIREYLSGGSTEDEVIQLLQNSDEESEVENTRRLRTDYVQYYGHAAEAAVDRIAEHLGLGDK